MSVSFHIPTSIGATSLGKRMTSCLLTVMCIWPAAANPAFIFLSPKVLVIKSYPSIIPGKNQHKHSIKLGKDILNPDS